MRDVEKWMPSMGNLKQFPPVKRIQKGGEECTEIIRTPPKPWSTGSLLSSMAWTPRTKNKGCPMCTVCRAVLIQHIQLNHKTHETRRHQQSFFIMESACFPAQSIVRQVARWYPPKKPKNPLSQAQAFHAARSPWMSQIWVAMRSFAPKIGHR